MSDAIIETFEEYSVPATDGSGHSWLRHRNCRSERSCSICDGGLAVCTTCEGAEGELTKKCCGRPMTVFEKYDSLNNIRDFNGEKWVYTRPAHYSVKRLSVFERRTDHRLNSQGVCRLCGGNAASLTLKCCGRTLSTSEMRQIYYGERNFRTEWFDPRTVHLRVKNRGSRRVKQ